MHKNGHFSPFCTLKSSPQLIFKAKIFSKIKKITSLVYFSLTFSLYNSIIECAALQYRLKNHPTEYTKTIIILYMGDIPE